MSASKILTVLSGYTELSDLVNDRIELVPVTQGLKMPHVSYEFESDDPVNDLSGRANIERQEWSFYITSDKFLTAESVKNATIKALTTETTEFRAVYLGSDYQFDQESDIHQFELSLNIIYNTGV